MAITPSDFSKIWASNADTPEYTFTEADYLKGWDFVGNLPPTRAQWNAIQKRTDEKMKYVFDNFGAPLTASTVAGMTMQNRAYVYTGSETGYTAGHWYYWDGTAWTDGGVYNSNTVQVDPTLTISGAAADAKVTGGTFELFGAKDFLWQTTYDGNSKTQNGVTYTVDSSAKTVAMNGAASALSFYRFYNSTSALPAGMTIGKTYVAKINTDLNCSLQIFPYVNGSLDSSIVNTSSQVLFTIPEGTEGLLMRITVAKDNTVHGIVQPLIAEAFSLDGLFMGGAVINKGLLDNRKNVDTVTDTSVRYLTSKYTYTNIPLLMSYGGSAYLFTCHPINTPHILQTITYVGKKISYMRKNISGTWSDWETSTNNGIALSNNTDIDTLTDTGVYFLSDTHTYIHAPVDGKAFLLTSYKLESSLGVNVQIAYGFSTNESIYRRGRVGSGSWSAWTVIGGGSGGTVYNNTYEFNEYQSTNTYNVTPTITTDTHNFLAPTGDATDRKGAIETLLSTNGICHLAPGEFYVSGIDMPAYSKLMGCGNFTKIILLGTDTTEGYAVKMDTGCVVSDMLIAGNSQYHIDDSSSYPSATEYVQRHGILWQGNASGDNNHIPKIGAINNCYICNFTGGGITGYDSGMSILSGLSVSNCYIWYCHSGVNMRYLTEFSKFTNVSANRCHYGCVANGGNLVFVNCNFSANICGLLMDDSTGQSPNNSHGSFVGCVFDHSDGNTGYAMMLYGLDHGEIFNGCQVFFGKTLINNCKGVRFVGGNYGRQTDITINDSSAVTYDSCQFRASSETQVNLTGNTGVFFNNCLLYEGTVFNPV